MKRKALSCAVMAVAAGFALVPVTPTLAEELEEVAVTGVRGKPRSVSDSPVPVDVFGSEALQ